MGHKRALGVLAYAEAFQSVLGRVKRNPQGSFEPISRGPLFDFQHTRLSLEATIEEQSFRMNTRSNAVGFIVATLLGAMALWLAAVQVKDALCLGVSCAAPEIPPFAKMTLATIIVRPEIPLGFLLLLGWLYFEFTRRALTVLGPVKGYTDWISEWAVAWGASVSRYYRRKFAPGGDTIGNAISLLTAATFLAAIVYLVGALFQLWPFQALWRAIF
jgi:hypothetical protein